MYCLLCTLIYSILHILYASLKVHRMWEMSNIQIDPERLNMSKVRGKNEDDTQNRQNEDQKLTLEICTDTFEPRRLIFYRSLQLARKL